MKKRPWPANPQHKKKFYLDIIKTGEFIYQAGDWPQLRQGSKPVEDITSSETQEKIAYLKKCLLRYRKLTGMGRGIAGVQVGIHERIFAVYMPEIKGSLLTVINPKITKVSTSLFKYSEMCMSAAPLIASVARPAWIELEYYDEKGNKKYWSMKSNTKKGKIYNRVLLHEIDHLDGILNIDRVQSKELVFEFDPAHAKHVFEKI